MPPYFSIELAFPYSSLNSSFVLEFYSVLFSKYPYKSGFWNSESNTLDEIIIWNQQLLENKFILGFDEHVNNDYKQILLMSETFSELRHFWSYSKYEIRGTILIPEYDVLTDEDVWRFSSNQFDEIKDFCEWIWVNSSIEILQTCLEMDGGPINTSKINTGVQPYTHPISIVSEKTFKDLKGIKESIVIKSTEKNGVMMIDQRLRGWPEYEINSMEKTEEI
jgi:hypothetical protein